MSKPSTTYHSPSTTSPRVAIIHDWLVGGGAEHVVYELHKMFPRAPIYTAFCNERSRKMFKDAEIHVSFMQKFPFNRLYKFLPVLRQHWFQNLDLRGFDIIISSSGAEAKAVRSRPDALHINYCHSPTHYYWIRYEEYMKHPGFGLLNPIARLGLRLLVKPNRNWDYGAAQHANYLIANSTTTKERIERFYNRESTVIHPPVDTGRFAPKNDKRHVENEKSFVITGRQTPYKRIDLAVAACTIANLPLTVIGDGPEHKELKKLAGPTITFKGYLPEEEVANELQKASAFIMPNEDDFGIAPVEALAAGLPVIAYKAGGALDYMKPGVTGEFFSEQTPEALAKILTSFKPEKYDPKKIASHAQIYSVEAFHKNISRFINEKISSKI